MCMLSIQNGEQTPDNHVDNVKSCFTVVKFVPKILRKCNIFFFKSLLSTFIYQTLIFKLISIFIHLNNL